MKTRKQISSFLLTVLLSLMLVGCGDNPTASDAGSSARSVATQIAPSQSGSGGTSDNSSTPKTTNEVKLTVVKYVAVAGGTTTSYIGSVRNDGSSTVGQPLMELVDDSGKATDEAETLLPRVVLPPGQSAGFHMTYMGDEIKHPQFKFSADSLDSQLPPAKLTVVSSKLAAPQSGSPTIEGEVSNEGDKQAVLWSVNAVAYDDSGQVVDVGSGGAANAGDSLKAHTTIKFRVYLGRNDIKVAKYDLLASGFQGDLP